MIVLNTIATWLAGVPWGLYLLAGGASLVLAVSEVVSSFELDPVRALRTWGSTLLLLLNVTMAVLILALMRSLGTAGDSPWVALTVGLGLPTVVRTRFTVMKPLPGTAGSEGVEIRLDELYDRLQSFCRRRIDVALAGQRVRMVEQAMDRLALDDLERKARLLLEGGLVVTASQASGYVDKILDHQEYDEERKRMLLSFAILNYGGHGMLEEMLKSAKAKPPA
ncbi:MAG: hypothetical protein FJ014_15375 [Chloroflexi bacterium]|nr:hypothetical protein [Chloroflexota bacterium]